MSDRSAMSWASQGSTVEFEKTRYDDPRQLFKAMTANISFGHPNDSAVVIENEKSVYELIENGPTSIIGKDSSDVRWIHLPANNMAWVEELMSSLRKEQKCIPNSESDDTTTNFDGVLREDLWKKSLHGRQSMSIHSRFMMPFATHYSPFDPESSESDDGDMTWSNKAHVVVLYMPYLHWEAYGSWKDRQGRISELKKLKLSDPQKACDCLKDANPGPANLDLDARRNEAMLHKYLYDSSPLHDRRTLDQSYFYNLRNVAFRDVDQVIGQHTWVKSEQGCKSRKMMMVDQLWMWIVDRRTVITAFPETDLLQPDGNKYNNETSVLGRVLEVLPSAIQQGSVKSINSLTSLIIDQCTGVFHHSDIHPDLAFFEFFADEIGEVKSDIERMYSDFRAISVEVEKLWFDNTISFTDMSRRLTDMFSIGEQIAKIEDIEKIISDLDKIDYLLNVQQSVVQDFTKCCRPTHNPERNSRSLIELGELIRTRRESWSGMNDTAKSLRKSLHNLLDLKQRQAAVSEARTARNQIAIAAQQGNSVMVLTIFTVILLPVSVIAAIFGMNAEEFEDGGKVSVRTICLTTIPISVTLLLGVLLFAFSGEVRAFARKFIDTVFPTDPWGRLVSKSKESDAKV